MYENKNKIIAVKAKSIIQTQKIRIPSELRPCDIDNIIRQDNQLFAQKFLTEEDFEYLRNHSICKENALLFLRNRQEFCCLIPLSGLKSPDDLGNIFRCVKKVKPRYYSPPIKKQDFEQKSLTSSGESTSAIIPSSHPLHPLTSSSPESKPASTSTPKFTFDHLIPLQNEEELYVRTMPGYLEDLKRPERHFAAQRILYKLYNIGATLVNHNTAYVSAALISEKDVTQYFISEPVSFLNLVQLKKSSKKNSLMDVYRSLPIFWGKSYGDRQTVNPFHALFLIQLALDHISPSYIIRLVNALHSHERLRITRDAQDIRFANNSSFCHDWAVYPILCDYVVNDPQLWKMLTSQKLALVKHSLSEEPTAWLLTDKQKAWLAAAPYADGRESLLSEFNQWLDYFFYPQFKPDRELKKPKPDQEFLIVEGGLSLRSGLDIIRKKQTKPQTTWQDFSLSCLEKESKHSVSPVFDSKKLVPLDNDPIPHITMSDGYLHDSKWSSRGGFDNDQWLYLLYDMGAAYVNFDAAYRKGAHIGEVEPGTFVDIIQCSTKNKGRNEAAVLLNFYSQFVCFSGAEQPPRQTRNPLHALFLIRIALDHLAPLYLIRLIKLWLSQEKLAQSQVRESQAIVFANGSSFYYSDSALSAILSDYALRRPELRRQFSSQEIARMSGNEGCGQEFWAWNLRAEQEDFLPNHEWLINPHNSKKQKSLLTLFNRVLDLYFYPQVKTWDCLLPFPLVEIPPESLPPDPYPPVIGHGKQIPFQFSDGRVEVARVGYILNFDKVNKHIVVVEAAQSLFELGGMLVNGDLAYRPKVDWMDICYGFKSGKNPADSPLFNFYNRLPRFSGKLRSVGQTSRNPLHAIFLIRIALDHLLHIKNWPLIKALKAKESKVISDSDAISRIIHFLRNIVFNSGVMTGGVNTISFSNGSLIYDNLLHAIVCDFILRNPEVAKHFSTSEKRDMRLNLMWSSLSGLALKVEQRALMQYCDLQIFSSESPQKYSSFLLEFNKLMSTHFYPTIQSRKRPALGVLEKADIYLSSSASSQSSSSSKMILSSLDDEKTLKNIQGPLLPELEEKKIPMTTKSATQLQSTSLPKPSSSVPVEKMDIKKKSWLQQIDKLSDVVQKLESGIQKMESTKTSTNQDSLNERIRDLQATLHEKRKELDVAQEMYIQETRQNNETSESTSQTYDPLLKPADLKKLQTQLQLQGLETVEALGAGDCLYDSVTASQKFFMDSIQPKVAIKKARQEISDYVSRLRSATDTESELIKNMLFQLYELGEKTEGSPPDNPIWLKSFITSVSKSYDEAGLTTRWGNNIDIFLLSLLTQKPIQFIQVTDRNEYLVFQVAGFSDLQRQFTQGETMELLKPLGYLQEVTLNKEAILMACNSNFKHFTPILSTDEIMKRNQLRGLSVEASAASSESKKKPAIETTVPHSSFFPAIKQDAFSSEDNQQDYQLLIEEEPKEKQTSTCLIS